jgi:LCP family protein required for cell wall assembly
MADDDQGRRPEYKVYRSRRSLRDMIRPPASLAALRERTLKDRPEAPPGEPPRRRRITPGRVVKWIALAILGWILLSVVLFFISAQLHQGVDPSAERALSGGSSTLTGTTVLVLGSDKRPRGTKEGGAGGPGRADTIMLLRASVGEMRRLSILRDSFAQIPGDGQQKINAAYAIGGSGLQIRTIEDFMANGLEVNHLIEVNFENFPTFIDALGGIDVELKRCVSTPPFGGKPFRLRAGEHHLDGETALRFARVRANRCAPNEGDEKRAERQQQVLSAIRSRMFSPAGFIRWPWAAWAAPRAIDTDMAGPGLFGLAFDVLTGGGGETKVLESSGPGPGGSELISPEERELGVRHLRGGRPQP